MTQNIRGMPVMPGRCSTCPFNPNGDPELRARIELRCLTTASQTCHSSGMVHGAPDTYVCRGARDFQLTFFHRIGFIDDATDEAWARKAAELKLA